MTQPNARNRPPLLVLAGSPQVRPSVLAKSSSCRMRPGTIRTTLVPIASRVNGSSSSRPPFAHRPLGTKTDRADPSGCGADQALLSSHSRGGSGSAVE